MIYFEMLNARSLKQLRKRHRGNKLVRRRGRIFIINEQNPKFKVRQ